jgi:hypothetical protein
MAAIEAAATVVDDRDRKDSVLGEVDADRRVGVWARRR